MQVMKSLFISLMLLVPFLKSYASSLKDSTTVGLNSYNDTADVQVYSPTFSLMKTLSKNFLIGVKLRVDTIAAASFKNGGSPAVVDVVTGASPKEGTFEEVRYAPTLTMAYEDTNNALSGGVYYSTESDYEGRAFFINYTRQLNEQNTAIGIGISQSDDTWIPAFDRNLPRDDRKEGKIDMSINQLLSPTASIQFIYSLMYSEGFLASPYNYVKQDTFAKFEKYPETRTAHAFAFKGIVMLNDRNSINYSYRYYADDWDISSHTVSTEWLSDFGSSVTSGLRLRYYSQSDAFFAKDVGAYGLDDQYFAVDYRMSAFDSYDIGIPFIYKPSISSPYKVTASIDMYQTTENAYIKNWYDIDKITAVYTTLSIEYDF
ncbi:DUF3570 domain-containing protein [Sulfurimonas sp.]|uniref:DUF3570 domain-containing protein n=1 Tax=Sulfurimonas sp. TaxID=2022749 RepID=UPI0025FAF8F7|nr:DUF3570 domain-containing protein [Sulfurimonas sp.]MBT5934093.1 DUF3570 domain-containing protein [Sulfurimonas sp.]